ncbi:MAG: hypothetical protein UR66_C0010G0013 [Candidatus Moranbacteria bacterium GW2011_GWE1_35_17]|nr:MAG: hypothetical protein UR66_C0010G0013 [Candidatus Moranbacteria bacterium GW2011_GWE1_35_17]KKP71909.1 MAG: hypothetical protein UR65_C0024G0005 [Candidatus Moranbacteria bacterium GW2011_GWE2_35_164]KKP80584.1 MAG: hypothetical protein UR82_C0089G0003 [Candidatus Moranbacteria bacterium GW2011_GWF1_35_5]KKP83208.1 MAG: hypothetical protein UR83_C0038G0011 [Candidatus Moranbacteria bacterium GW2011_GWF2_35_54]
MKNEKLIPRQEMILSFIEGKGSVSGGQISEHIAKELGKITRMTISRDLEKMIQAGLVERRGTAGRAVTYQLSSKYPIAKKIDVEEYFSRPFSEREAKPLFNDEILSVLNDSIFSGEEMEILEKANEKYIETRNKLAKDSPTIFRKEWERLIIELSWKSSEIEGNTYTLLETEMLIREMHFAKGKNKSEAQMILNHKKTLDFILTNDEYFKDITLDKIIKIHELLTEKIDIKKDFRDHPVGITGTIYRPIPKKKDIAVVMKKLVEVLERTKNPFAKSFIVLIMIAYIQPFEDGNKRTSRIIANAILHAHSKSMLSYRDVDTIEYKKTMILFYEQNNISYIKEIFMQQFEFAVENYFG